ncbi:ASCH domain-containing protein [Zooshikella marina]|uniref:ASCH domain-containing protein n=1 Tax=Zooshikella ganghwensis TaxID=202772 RepID=UPI001BB0720C|nr:ASCH domain-containing protein [Zooshikella ganghwensis]MBU2708962.1 ASCH domain-containing protein [Zooshikella ganghwensis]
MKVLLSIKPEYAEKILSGKKKYEFRKALFKNRSVKIVVIYATKPVGMIIGEFEIDDILQDQPSVIWKKTRRYSGITKDFFEEYFSGKDKAVAIKIKNPFTYQQPFELTTVVPSGVPPQSFCYLN